MWCSGRGGRVFSECALLEGNNSREPVTGRPVFPPQPPAPWPASGGPRLRRPDGLTVLGTWHSVGTLGKTVQRACPNWVPIVRFLQTTIAEPTPPKQLRLRRPEGETTPSAEPRVPSACRERSRTAESLTTMTETVIAKPVCASVQLRTICPPRRGRRGGGEQTDGGGRAMTTRKGAN